MCKILRENWLKWNRLMHFFANNLVVCSIDISFRCQTNVHSICDSTCSHIYYHSQVLHSNCRNTYLHCLWHCSTPALCVFPHWIIWQIIEQCHFSYNSVMNNRQYSVDRQTVICLNILYVESIITLVYRGDNILWFQHIKNERFQKRTRRSVLFIPQKLH